MVLNHLGEIIMNKSTLIILLFSSISYCQLVVGDTIPDELGWGYCFNNDTEFDIELTNLGDYPLDFTTTVDAEFGGWVWLSVVERGDIPGTSSALVTLSVQNTSNLDPGIYSGSIYFGTNTGSSDPDLIITNTDTVDVFLTLLVDDSQ